MQIPICDICKSVIKEGHTKHMLYQQDILIKAKATENREEFVRRYQQAQESPVDIKEICEGCKKVYDYIFSLRIKKSKCYKKRNRKILFC